MDVRSPSPSLYVFDHFRLDPGRMTLVRDGAIVPTTPRVIATLLYLVERAGHTVTREEMLRALWPGRTADEANLNQAVSAVRKALASEAGTDDMIVTVPGHGYRFTSKVATRAEAEIEEGPVLHPLSPALARTRKGLWPAVWLTAAVLLFGAGLAGVWRLKGPSAHLDVDRTTVVLADLQNGTGDPVFNRVIPRVLQIDLMQSPFLQVAGDDKVAASLKLMERSRDGPLTLGLAKEVCARSNGGAVIAPAVDVLGPAYIVTLAASDCVSGQLLYQDKMLARDKEGVVRALDALSARTRLKLGETRSSIARFNVPLAPERTRSFAALLAFSDAEWLERQGKRLEAGPFYRHAVELDPDFTMAYFSLAWNYYSLGQPREEAAAISEAHKRVSLVSERSALLIENLYNVAVTRDLDAAREKMELMTQLYPKDASAWVNLSDTRYRLADYQGAAAAGQQALRLDPKLYSAYTVLARALNHLQQTARAEQVDEASLRKLPETGMIRQQRIGWRFLQGDGDGGRRLVASAVGTPLERDALLEAYNFAFAEGRLRDAARLMARAEVLGRAEGMHADLTEQTSNYADVGLLAKARVLLDAVPPELWNAQDDYDAARVDDPARAQADLARDLARWPRDTVLNGKSALQVRAVLLLRHGHALQAARMIDGVGRLMFRDLDAPFLQATAFLAAGDAPAAEADYRAILAQTGFAWSVQYPLSHLGLARALRLQGDLTGSRRQYEAFLTAWRHADADLAPLQQAKAEYAGLLNTGTHPVSPHKPLGISG